MQFCQPNQDVYQTKIDNKRNILTLLIYVKIQVSLDLLSILSTQSCSTKLLQKLLHRNWHLVLKMCFLVFVSLELTNLLLSEFKILS